jgi:hypothetical protein
MQHVEVKLDGIINFDKSSKDVRENTSADRIDESDQPL